MTLASSSNKKKKKKITLQIKVAGQSQEEGDREVCLPFLSASEFLFLSSQLVNPHIFMIKTKQ